MTSILKPIIDAATEIGTFIWAEIPKVTSAVTGNGIIMAFLGIAIVGGVVGMFSRLLRSV